MLFGLRSHTAGVTCAEAGTAVNKKRTTVRAATALDRMMPPQDRVTGCFDANGLPPASAGRVPLPAQRPGLGSATDVLTIAQLSDIHCGSQYFDPDLLSHAVEEILALQPDMVVVAGDLTQEGYANEFQMARDALRPLVDELLTVIVPGNHDAKNVGYVHFRGPFRQG